MKSKLAFLFFIPFFLFAEEHILSLGSLGSVRYSHENQRLNHIDRLLPNGEILYTHTYNYNEQGQIISESLIGNLGDIQYGTNYSIKSPYHFEAGEYDSRQNLVKHTHDETIREYEYNCQNELICADSTEHLEYDRQGNLIQNGDIFYTYDNHHKLLKVRSPTSEVTYTYDDQGNRISKTSNGITETYIFYGINELVVLDENKALKQLRIAGQSSHPDRVRAIAIETPSAIYAPIHDIQGNITKLIDILSGDVTTLDIPDPFGRGLSNDSPTPWIYSSKHYDPESGLVYFGHRFYCPSIKKWLTPDPLFQTKDPYEYCMNNPFAFFDPDGRFALELTFVNFVWGTTSALTFPVWGTGALVATSVAIVGYAGYKGVKYINNNWQNSQEQRAYEQKLAEQGIFPTIMEKNEGTPGSNKAQNKQFKDAKKEVEREIGRKLTDKEERRLHDYATKQGYNYQELVREGKVIFHGK